MIQNNPRLSALYVLKAVESDGAYLNIAISKEFELSSLAPLDRSLCAALAEGVLERKLTLDFIISQLTTYPLKSMEPNVINLLRLGLLQIYYMDKIPPFAACNETVTVAKQCVNKKSVPFINAILRNAVRKKDEIVAAVNNAPANISYSVSADIYQLINTQYHEKAESILQAFFEKSPLTLRCNTLKTTRFDLLARFGGKPAEKDGIVLQSNVESICDGLNKGEFYVQGLSSQRAVALLNAKSGDFIVDVCACPGGKSFGAAIDMNNTGKVLSLDIHENKLNLILSTASDLGISIIEVRKWDSSKPVSSLISKADKVICDVPCSGIGSIGKRPEIRTKTLAEIDALVDTQKRILNASVNYLKRGSVLIYSVCSINKREGEDVVNNLLEKNKSVTLVQSETVLPAGGYDGFYIAKLLKG